MAKDDEQGPPFVIAIVAVPICPDCGGTMHRVSTPGETKQQREQRMDLAADARRAMGRQQAYRDRN